MLAYTQRTAISTEDFDYFRARVHEIAGINLGASKRELLQARLVRRLDDLKMGGFEDYRAYLQSLPSDHPEWQNLVNEVTTNKTDFFREAGHFQHLLDSFLPDWKRRNPERKLSAWSAACSTGEEPYTLAMVLDRFFNGLDQFRVVASDVDTEALAHAKNGVYPMDRLAPVPDEFRARGISEGTGDISGWGKIRSQVRQRVTFRQGNLVRFPYPSGESHDIILCRNVFIYFRPETIEQVVNEMHRIAAPGAVLMIGHAETLQNLKHPWKPSGPAIFRKAVR